MPAPNGFHAVPEAAVLAAARRGEARAFEVLYGLYRDAAYTLALRMLGEPAAAEDVVQEVFVRLFDRIRGFRGEAPFGAWLRRLVANAAVDEMRRRRWFDEADPELLAAAPGALAERETEAWQLLQRLPRPARAALVLHAVEGWTHRELAVLFGQSESYSKSLLSRALARLQRELEQDEHARRIG